MCHHSTADDAQLYITFKTLFVGNTNQSRTKLVNCDRYIDTRMLWNELKLSKDKSQDLVMSSFHRPRPTLVFVVVGEQ